MTTSTPISVLPPAAPPNLADLADDLHRTTDSRRYPEVIIDHALAVAFRPLVTTNFRPGSAALLHLLVSRRPDLPVIWIDTGYNTAETYRYVDFLSTRLSLNLRIYSPKWTGSRVAALRGPLPRPGDDDFDAFVEVVKLEPFRRAFEDFEPDVWFTGIRRDQSAYRNTLGSISRGYRGVLRVAPTYYWDHSDVDEYLERYAIADNTDYVDPTKPGDKLECGLQQLS